MSRFLSFLTVVVCLAFPAFGITRSWTGSVDAAWSNPANWSPNGVPATSDALVFPVGGRSPMNNDLPAGTAVGPMLFNTSYTLNGNRLLLNGDLSFDQSTYPEFVCNANLTLGQSLTFGAAIQSAYNGTVDVNGHTLTVNTYNTDFNGAVNGSGAIALVGSGARFQHDGTFSGTVSGTLDVYGAVPNANVNGYEVAGTGSLGTVTASNVRPGVMYPGYTGDPHEIGVLQTKSLTIQSSFFVDLVPGSASDSVHVTGSVTIGGASLYASVPSGVPTTGQTFTIIDNDGADAVSGTFSGLAEGASLNVGAYKFTISYHGGDGNDVVLTAAQTKKSWSGAASANWSDPANWVPQAIPIAGEPLVFPVGGRSTMNNDLAAGFAVGPMTFNTSYTLNGNRLLLNGNLSFDQSTYPDFVCNADLTLGQSLTFGAAIQSTYNGTVDVNGHTLTVDTYNTDFKGAVNGSGAIALVGSGSRFQHDGTFSGTVSGTLDVYGAVPNANVNGYEVTGNGSLGTITASNVRPGVKNPPFTSDPHEIGVLQTKSLTIQSAFFVDLVPGSTSDSVHVIGSVTIGGASLFASIPAGIPTPGQAYTIIDNDGADAVSGTFSGLVEGASLTIGAYKFTISYHGGDGNDVVLATAVSKKSWTGAASANWSDPANWVPQAIPAASEPLVFPAGGRSTMNNDLPAGFAVGPMTFNTSYTLNGNRLLLNGNLSFDQSTYPDFVCNADLTLGQSLTFGAAIQSAYNGTVDVNGHTLTVETYNTDFKGAVNGSGAIALVGSGSRFQHDGTFSGTVSGTLDVYGAVPNANITGYEVTGSGSLGTVTASNVRPGVKNPPYTSDPHTSGVLQTKSLTIQSAFLVDLVPGATSDSVHVTGNATINGASLYVSVPSGVPSVGQAFTIIDNDGSDAVNGTFANLPEGSRINAAGYAFRVSYHGGDGNDVVLTTGSGTATTLAQTSSSTTFGEPVTFNATVTADVGVPTGSLLFMEGAATLATVPLQNGSAHFTTSALHAGAHSITAVYGGEGAFFASASAPLSHSVQHGQTATTITCDKTSATYGDVVTCTVSVAAVAPAAGTPGGTITIRNGAASLGTAELANGSASIPLTLHAGAYALTAAYGGNADFAISESGATSITVAQAATSITVTGNNNPVRAGRSVTLTLSAGTAAGTVTVSEHGKTLAEEPINGTATVKLKPLAPGNHELLISFAGSGDYKPSSTTFTAVVVAPAVSADDVVVSEGDEPSKSVMIAVHLSAAATQTITVDWSTADGSAIAGHEYEAASGALTFQPGETEHAVPVVIHGNTTPEDDKNFSVVLSNVVNATIEHSATVIIGNDDAAWKTLGQFTYTTTPSGPLTLDLYAPASGEGRRPLVMWIPGLTSYGGDGGASAALRQTTRGYLVAVVRYREPAVAHFPAQLNDLQAAVRWLRANADQFQILSDRIAAWGNGTGAHLAALLGTASLDDRTSNVQAVVDWNGAADLGALNADASCSFVDHDDAASPESALIGCPLPACPDSARAASPLSFAGPRSAPFLIMHGGDNCFVAQSQSRRLHAALKQAGVDSLLYVLNGVGLVDPFWSSTTANAAVDEFLDSHLRSAPVRHRPAR